jgi:hypothetical protein
MDKLFEMADRIWRQQGVGANVAHFGRDVFNDHQFIATPDGMDNHLSFISAWTALNTAIHDLAPLSNGVVHFGGFGS